MTTSAQIREAHADSPKHRFALRDLLKVNEALVKPKDRELIDKLHAAKTPAEFDEAMHSLAFNQLFVRGVIYIGGKK